MTDPTKNDAELDEYLAGDSALSRVYRGASDELPPAHLDARILSEARRADAPASTAPGPFSGRWMVPASLAVIVLAVSVVALLPEPETRLSTAPGKAEDQAVGEADAGAGGAALKVAPEPARIEMKKSAEESAGARERSRSSISGGETPGRDADQAAGSGSAAPQGEVVPLPMYDLRAPAESTVPEAPARSKAFGEYGTGDEQPKGSNEAQERRAAEIEPRSAAQPLAEEAPDLQVPDSESAPAAASRARSDEKSSFAPPPDAAAWLERIADLVEKGEKDAAMAELRAFRRRYPSVDIPPAIRSALETSG